MHRLTCTAALVLVALTTAPAGAYRQTASPAPGMLTRASERLPPTTGTLAVSGLKAEVRVVRDQWGVPHISAKTQDDLFFAQGFVQAQDRLLWTSAEPGTAGYLANIGIGRARTSPEFRESLARWKMPGENIVYADAERQHRVSSLRPDADSQGVVGFAARPGLERRLRMGELVHARRSPARG